MENSVRVLSTLALAGAVRALATKYLALSGARIDADFAPTVRLLERLKEGETADVLILTQEGLAGLASVGSVVAESCVDLARSYIGLAVKAGASHPDISTEAAALNAPGGAFSCLFAARRQRHFLCAIDCQDGHRQRDQRPRADRSHGLHRRASGQRRG